MTEKNDYLNSCDDKNDAFFMIYFVIQVVGVITLTLSELYESKEQSTEKQGERQRSKQKTKKQE